MPQHEFMQAAGFTLFDTTEEQGVVCYVWMGHDLNVTIDTNLNDPRLIMQAILTAQKLQIADANRQHMTAIIGPFPRV